MARQLSKAVRREALERSDGRCSLCATDLLAPQIHHIEFFSEGGTDDPTNLTALCPTCHMNFPHRLYRSDEGDVIRNAALEWERLVRVDRLIRAEQPWQKVAMAVVDPAVRQAVLLLGTYELFCDWAETLLAQYLHQGRDGELLKFRLTVLAAEIATYCGRGRATTERLANLGRASRSIEVGQKDLNALALAQAKTAHLDGDLDGEEQALAKYVPLFQEDLDFEFRTISFALKAGRTQPLPRTPGPADRANLSLATRLSAANIVGDRGRWMLSVGRDEDAYRELAQSFAMARLTFHRRGMFAKAMLLADTALRLEEGRWAAEWWLIGMQFRLAGHNLELEPEPLRRRIFAVAGDRIFSEIRVTIPPSG